MLKTEDMEPCIIETGIINPDGMPFKPSPTNALQILLGPEKAIPLAIEEAAKAVTYNPVTGDIKSEYDNVKHYSKNIAMVLPLIRKKLLNSGKLINGLMHILS